MTADLIPGIIVDTFTPVQQAFLIQQKLTEIKYADHTFITY